MEAQRGTCQPDGSRTRGGSKEDSAGAGGLAGRSQRSLHADSPACNREDQGTVLLLSVDRGGVYRALDVLVRHDGGGCTRFCERGGGSGEGLMSGSIGLLHF